MQQQSQAVNEITPCFIFELRAEGLKFLTRVSNFVVLFEQAQPLLPIIFFYETQSPCPHLW